MPSTRDPRELDLLLARGKAVGPAADALWERVAETLPPARKPRRWALRFAVAVPVFAGAAAAIVVLAGRPPSELREKGPAAAVLVDLVCSGGSRDACPAGSTLLFAVGGTARPTFLSAWAAEVGSGQRIWYFGGQGAPLPLEAMATAAPLGKAVALGPEHRPGRYEVHWVLTETPVQLDGRSASPSSLASGTLLLTVVAP